MDKEIVQNLNISNEAIATYCILRSIMNQGQNCYGITLNHFPYYGMGELNPSRYTREIFMKGIDELVKASIIKNPHKFGISDYLLDLSKIRIEKNSKRFIVIDFGEVKTILSNCGGNRFSVLRYFILLLSTFSSSITVYLNEIMKKNNVISTMPIEYLCMLTGLSKATIITYNKILEDLQLLYIYHAADYYCVDSRTIKSPPNVYGRYCDKDYVDQYVKNSAKYYKYGNYDSDSKAKANHKRRLAQRYNQFMSGRHEYSREEIQEVYDYISSENSKYQVLYEKSKYEPYKEKIRDIAKLKILLKKENATTQKKGNESAEEHE